MKNLLMSAALCIAATSTAADQENFLLHSYKDWKVYFTDWGADGTSCDAIFNGTLSTFLIQHYDNGALLMQFFDGSDAGVDIPYVDVFLKVDNRTAWAIDGEIWDSHLYIHLIDKRLLVQIMEGRKLYLYDGEGDLLYSYSLRGSKAAMYALAECARKL